MKTMEHSTKAWNAKRKASNDKSKSLLLAGDLDGLIAMLDSEQSNSHSLRCNACKTSFTTDGDEERVCPKCHSRDTFPCDVMGEALQWASHAKKYLGADELHTFPRFFCRGCKHFEPITTFIGGNDINASYCGLYYDPFEQADVASDHFTVDAPVDLPCHDPPSHLRDNDKPPKFEPKVQYRITDKAIPEEVIDHLEGFDDDNAVTIPPPDDSDEDLDTMYEVSGQYEQLGDWHDFSFKVPKGLPKSFKSADDAGQFQIIDFGLSDLLINFRKFYLSGTVEFTDGEKIHDQYTITYTASYKETINGDKVFEGEWINKYFVETLQEPYGNRGKCRLTIHQNAMK